LQREIANIQENRERVYHPEQVQMVRVEVVSTRDVVSFIRGIGGRIRADIGGEVTAAEVPVNQVAALARHAGVQGLFPSRRLRSEADISVADIRANQVWALHDTSGLPVQGQHVLIGVVDAGVDYHSADFTNPDGTTRIRAIWDQTLSGHAPQGFNYGYECDSASIENGSCPERDDLDGHGTHVLGIAAGNGRSSTPSKEFGVAPQADILVVKSDLTTDNMIAGWKYLVDKAAQLHEPIVINNSFGDQDGPHNGSEPEARALDRLSGPGRIFVKSAGNAGHEGAHAGGSVRQNQTRVLQFAPTGYSTGFDLEVFYSAHASLSISLRNVVTGERIGPVENNASLQRKRSRDRDTLVTLESGRYSAGYHEIYLLVESASHRALHGRWRLVVRGKRVSGAARYDAWMQGSDDAEFRYPNESDTMSIPGDAHRVITVANYATSTSWRDIHNTDHQVCDNYVCIDGVLSVGDIAASSSEGPTADGRHKPDIAAPGTMITSTLSHDEPVCSGGSYSNCIDPAQISPDGNHLTYTGTSMSAPHVTGTIALMLQIDPTLSPAAADSILTSTTRRDLYTGLSGWSPQFGAGKLDALAAVQKTMGLLSAQRH